MELKEQGGIKSITILKEEVVGDVAEVNAKSTKGNGEVVTMRCKLIKEQGAWKIDGVATASSMQVEESDS